MKIKDSKYWLLGVTLIFLLLGGFVVYLFLQKLAGKDSCTFNNVLYTNNSEIPNYKKDYVCKCENGVISCVSLSDLEAKPTLSKFRRDNLRVTPKYLISGTKELISSTPLKTKFISVSNRNNVMNITIEQEQKCTPDFRIPVQIGMYYYANNKLYITNIVNKAPTLYTEECIVSVTYAISNLKYVGNDLSVIYFAEDGEQYSAAVCNYDNNIYSEDDVYSATDSCNICKCIGGISKCSNDRVCK